MIKMIIFIISIAVLAVILIIGFIKRQKQVKKKIYRSRILMFGFFGATFVWCLGALLVHEEIVNNIAGNILVAVQSALRVFAMDFDYDFFKYLIASENEIVKNIYACYTSFLLFIAPVITASVVLSFFNEKAAFLRLWFSWNKRIFVFSELNRESLELAKSCHKKEKEENKKALIIFTDVYKSKVEHLTEMLEEAYDFGAICIEKDILSLNYHISSSKSKGKYRETCEFFVMGKNEEENVRHAFELLKKYHMVENVKVYLFSESNVVKIITTAMIESKNEKLQAEIRNPIREKIEQKVQRALEKEHLNKLEDSRLNKKLEREIQEIIKKQLEKEIKESEEKKEKADKVSIREELREKSIKMTFRCINLKQNVIYNYLYTHNLFFDVEESRELLIGVVGSGIYAKELIKGLLWYGQMPGFKLKIHVFDESGSLEEYFAYECPELMDKRGDSTVGEAEYELDFHECGPGTRKYAESLKRIQYFSHLYFMDEKDDKNIENGIDSDKILKMYDSENETKIICLICDPVKKEILQRKEDEFSLKDYRKEPYNLVFLYEEWSYKFAVNSDMEEDAQKEHLKWVNNPYYSGTKKDDNIVKMDEEDSREEFYNYEYNYRSSVARTIRARKRGELDEKEFWKDLPISEKWGESRSLEVSKEQDARDEKAKNAQREAEHKGWNAYMRAEGFCYGEKNSARYKRHRCLKSFEELHPEDKEKDDDLPYKSKSGIEINRDYEK